MMPTKFTQEIKDNWLNNLKSAKYKQGFEDLETAMPDGTISHCCIGVLGKCTEGLDNCLNRPSSENSSPYTFLENTIGISAVRDLWSTNDNLNYRKTGKTDYSNVIPIIEKLPIQD